MVAVVVALAGVAVLVVVVVVHFARSAREWTCTLTELMLGGGGATIGRKQNTLGGLVWRACGWNLLKCQALMLAPAIYPTHQTNGI